MARCSGCGGSCGCKIIAGENVSTTGSGSVTDPLVISAAGGEGGSSGWAAGDRKETYRQDTQAGWLDCLGQPVSRSTYAALFAEIGTRFGEGDGINTFNVPDETGRFSIGAGAGYAQDATGGASSTVLTPAMLPSHSHAMPHSHTIYHTHAMTHQHTISHQHSMNHTHSIAHDHPAVLTGSDGAHRHDLSKANSDTNGSIIARGSGSGLTNTGGIASDGAHTHTVNVEPYTGNSGGTTTLTDDSNTASSGLPSVPNTGGSSQDISGGPSVPNTSATGSGQSFTNLPPYRAIRVLIKT
jgi:microcystin-dependent protein